jgi:hypothetical protein
MAKTRRCKAGSNGPVISETTALQIERRARELRTKYKTRAPHMALTYAATEVLGCQPRRAVAGEGSLNYFRAIGRFHWDGSGERAAREAYKEGHRKGYLR